MKDTSFTTQDYPLATTLIALGFQLGGLNRTNPDRADFIFDRIDGLDEAIQSFWRGDLRVEPRAIFMAQKLLKSRLYSEE